MANYHGGRQFEYDVIHHLRDEGYEVIRSAGSKGKVDVLAFKTGEVLMVQAKRSGLCPPAERVELLRLAALIPGAVPLIASRPGVTFRELVGPGPREHQPWATDRAEEAS